MTTEGTVAAAPLPPVPNHHPPAPDTVPVIVEITPSPPDHLAAPGLTSMNIGC